MARWNVRTFWIRVVNPPVCVNSTSTGLILLVYSKCAHLTSASDVFKSSRQLHPTGSIMLGKDYSRLHGVAIAMNSGAHSSLVSCEPFSSRLAMAGFRSSAFDMSFKLVYDLTL